MEYIEIYDELEDELFDQNRRCPLGQKSLLQIATDRLQARGVSVVAIRQVGLENDVEWRPDFLNNLCAPLQFDVNLLRSQMPEASIWRALEQSGYIQGCCLSNRGDRPYQLLTMPDLEPVPKPLSQIFAGLLKEKVAS